MCQKENIFIMIFKFFVIFQVVTIETTVSVSFPLYTCCPKGYQFKEINNGWFKSTSFECEKISPSLVFNANTTDLYWSSTSSSSSPIYGYKIKESKEIRIPKNCDDLFIVKLSDEVQLSANSCVMKLDVNDGDFYALTCNGDHFQTVNILNKCCPYGESYSFTEKQCVPSTVSNEVFYVLFKNPVLFQNNAFNCPKSNVIIDYYTDYHNIKFESSNLIINTNYYEVENNLRSFDPDSYCIEAVISDNNKYFQSDLNSNDDNAMNETKYDDPDSSSLMRNKTRDKAFIRRISFLVRTCNAESVCDRVPCVRRCCDMNEKYVLTEDGPTCVQYQKDHEFLFFSGGDTNNSNSTSGIRDDLPLEYKGVQSKEYGILRGQTCPKYQLEPRIRDDEHYFDPRDGTLHLPNVKESYSNSDYCVEFLQEEENIPEVERYTYVCFPNVKQNGVKYILYPIGLLLSSVCCAATLIVYIFIPRLCNLPGKILVCLVLCLMTAYICLAFGQLSSYSGVVCYRIALFFYFSLLGAFTWMNIMCIDIWLTFSSGRNPYNSRKARDKRKFIFYLIYGWGFPLALALLMIFLDTSSWIPEEFQPHFGGKRCWFEPSNVTPRLLYYILPAGTMIFCNIVFFALTLRYCNKVKKEIYRMQSSNAEKPLLKKRFGMNRARFAMNMKMFVVMGISWALEIIGALVDDTKYGYLWFIIDFYNSLQGVFVFVIFVFKWKVWYSILDKIGIKYKKRYRHPEVTATTAFSPNGNLLRMKSMESCSSLGNSTIFSTIQGSRRNNM